MSDYDKGVFDCVMGVPHKKGQSLDYDRGYSSEYEKQKKRTAQQIEVEK